MSQNDQHPSSPKLADEPHPSSPKLADEPHPSSPKLADEPHPSFLELDRLALDAPASPATRAHVAACPVCQQHLASLAPPRDLTELPAIRRRVRAASTTTTTTKNRLRWAAPALAAAAAVALFVMARPPARVEPEASVPPQQEGFTTVKGGASVLLHIKRGERVFVWDGAEPVMPGDKLRLEVAADGFTHVAVLAEPAQGGARGAAPAVLYSAPIDPAQPVALPKAWEVDDTPGDESLIVVLSTSPLEGDAALEAARGGATPRDDDDRWTRRLVLPKRPLQEEKP